MQKYAADLSDSSITQKVTITKGTCYKFAGMYIGARDDPSEKRNSNILITHWIPDVNDKILYRAKNEFYKRDGIRTFGKETFPYKKGDHKYKVSIRKEPIYDSLAKAWETVKDYPQVSYGRTAFMREAFILDSDDTYSCINEAAKIIYDFCDEVGIEKPTSILRNPKSGHIQAAWQLKFYFAKDGTYVLKTFRGNITLNFENYTKLNKLLAKLFTEKTGKIGDTKFNGPSCKNPYYHGFESIVTDHVCGQNCCILTYLMKELNNHPEFLRKKRSTLVIPKAKLNDSTRGGVRHQFTEYQNNLEDETSRRAYEMSKFRSWYFNYRNSHDGKVPALMDSSNEIHKYAIEASTITHKSLHEESELMEIIRTVSTWCDKNYKKRPGGAYSEKRRSFGRFIQTMQRFLMSCQIYSAYFNDHMSKKEIMNLFGVSQSTVYRALKMSRMDFEQMAERARHFLRHAKGLESVSNRMFERIRAIKLALTSYYKYVQILFKQITEKFKNINIQVTDCFMLAYQMLLSLSRSLRV